MREAASVRCDGGGARVALPPPATPGPGGGGERAHWAVDDEGGDGPRSLSARGHPGPDDGG
jgi:hypothetical protein